MVSFNQFAFITTHAPSLLTSVRAPSYCPTAAVDTAFGKIAGAGDTASASAIVRRKIVERLALNDNDNTMDSSDDKGANNTNPAMHFLFVVHGHQGRPTDLSYLHGAAKAKAKDMGLFTHVKSSDSCVVGRRDQDATTIINTVQKSKEIRSRRSKRDRLPLLFARKNKHDEKNAVHDSVEEVASSILDGEDINDASKSTLVVHNAVCNEGKTHDGIMKGGERLANEMLEVIRSEAQQNQPQEEGKPSDSGPIDVTISIVGNSLGGLYGRYAIAHLAEVLDSPASCEENESYCYYLMDGNVRIHFNIFCSTASPHLGCASHTYIPIPRTAEIGVAQVLGETGNDLFRLNDLVETMATSPRFLKPLASFRRRIAYANAYNTDFPVPGTTAAFLDRLSDYPHYFEEHFEENDMGADFDTKELLDRTMNCPASQRGLIVATLRTPRLPLDEIIQTNEKLDNLTAMSSSLDALGWTKILIDIRNEIPMAVSFPNWSKSYCPISQLKSNNKAVTSRELEKAVSKLNGYRLSLPLGHNAICAFSRGTVSTVVNSGGRPVMDSLAMNLMNEISLWKAS